MTNNIKLYSLFSIVWSVAFFTALNWGTSASSQRWPYIILAAIIYGTGFALIGRYLGKKDDQSKVRYALKYAYSAVSNIASAIIGSLWILLFNPNDSWSLAMYLPGIILVGLIGYLDYKKSIKGMKSNELFK